MTARMWIRSCLALGLVGIVLAGYQIWDLHARDEAELRAARETTAQEAARASAEIDANLRQASGVVDALVSDLDDGRLDAAGLGARLEATLEADPELLGVGVAFRPERAGELEAQARIRRGESVEMVRLETRLDYTDPDVRWYADALAGGAGWREPTWDEAEHSMTAVYSAPFGPPDAGGVALVSVALDRVRERVAALDTGRTGWGAVISRDGSLLVHPDEQRVEDGVRVSDLFGAEPDANELAILRAIGESRRSFFERLDAITERNAWYFLDPVPATGWTLGLVRIEDEVLAKGRPHRRRVIRAAIATVLGLLLLGVPIAAAALSRREGDAALWAMAVWASLLMIVGLNVVRRVTYDQVSGEGRETVRVFDEGGLQAFVSGQNALWRERQETPPVPLPTGLLVRSLVFQNPTEVFVTGVLWQKLHDEHHAGLERGVELPDAVRADLEEVYRRRHGEWETVGWRFQATLQQVMDVSRYPLDHDNVAIRMLPRGFDGRVLLTPDLASYTQLTPAARPGLEETLELSGWRITGSFFDYKFAAYNTNLGIPDREGESATPELHFNVELKRNLLDAAIANGIPLLVVLVLLFAIMVTRTTEKEESKLFGFNPSGVMRICSALFFVVLLAHIQLRNTLQAEELVFLESSYFLVYLALLLTALHTFLFFKSGVQSKLVEYREGLVAKVLYWPLLLGLQLLAAVVFFY